MGETRVGLGVRHSVFLHVGEGEFEAQTLKVCFKMSDFLFSFFFFPSDAKQQDFSSFLQFRVVHLHCHVSE